MIRFFNTFTKITAYPVQKACFNTKILYEDKSVQNRHERDIYSLLSAMLREQDAKAQHRCDHIVIDPYAHLLSSFLL